MVGEREREVGAELGPSSTNETTLSSCTTLIPYCLLRVAGWVLRESCTLLGEAVVASERPSKRAARRHSLEEAERAAGPSGSS